MTPSLADSLRLRAPGWLACVLALFLGLTVLPAWAADDFLPPEQAFRVASRLAAPDRVEVTIAIASGYYLYRESLHFSGEGARLGQPQLPPGKVKFDENFQKNVETYRGDLRISLPLSEQTAAAKLSVVSQGCADAGLCYPPMTTVLALTPVSAGGVPPTQAATPAAKDGLWRRSVDAAWGRGDMIDEVLQGGRLWRVIGAFFAMGLLLSLTPCVLPMLPILSSLIVGTQRRPSRLRGLALAASYALGMAAVYTLLGVMAGLAGEGFAAALQTPWAIAGFALLLALFALAMFDVYELRLPHRFTATLSDHCNRLPAGQVAGVFVMGGVSALIVSPCVTAPLAGALLYISQTRDVLLGGVALFMMAVGMSVPLLLLGASAGRWLPKSGSWMHGVKRLFGILMLAVAVWIAQPVLPAAAMLALWGLLLLLLGIMLRPFHGRAHHHRHALRHWGQRALGAAALAMGLMQIVGAASGGRDPLQPLAHLAGGEQPTSALPPFRTIHSVAELDAVLQSAGRPVMLDFYADWCVSCKEMERFTFSDRQIAARLSAALLLKADVTANTEEDRRLLRRFSLFGPPGTLFFDAAGRPIEAARVVGFQGPRRFASTLTAAGL